MNRTNVSTKARDFIIIKPFKYPEGIKVEVIERRQEGNCQFIKVKREQDAPSSRFEWYIRKVDTYG